MKQILFFLTLFTLIGTKAHAQFLSKSDLTPDSTTYPNIYVKKIHTDERSSSFIIWVKQLVPPHKHVEHTEVVTVLSGKAIMTLGGQTRKIKKGDIILIPLGTEHSVMTKGREPLVVLSTQSPEFKGKDRIWIKPQR